MSYSSKEHDFDVITEAVLEAIVKCQDGRCAVTGIPLDFPADGLPVRMTFGKAMCNMPLIRQPTLVKVTSYNRWAVDNAIVISRAIRTFYDETPGWTACVQRLRDISFRPLPVMGQILEAMHVKRD